MFGEGSEVRTCTGLPFPTNTWMETVLDVNTGSEANRVGECQRRNGSRTSAQAIHWTISFLGLRGPLGTIPSVCPTDDVGPTSKDKEFSNVYRLK